MRRVYVAMFVVLLSLCGTLGLAQNATTSLRGSVKDSTGAVIARATITLLNPATGQSLNTKSAANGEYQFLQIPPAKYTITISATGFGDQTESAELLVNQPATIDFKIGVQAANVTVDVTAAAQTLNITDASLGSSTDNETIQALPSETRNVPDLLSLQPGVFFLPVPANPLLQDSRSGAVNGGRSDQGNITLDGVDDNDQVNGFAFTGVLRETQDSVEEFRVTTSNANADAGRSSGAQVSLVTKSGTNSFHGAAYEYNRPSNTVANDFFNKQAQLNSGLENRPGKLIRNIFGGDVGGWPKASRSRRSHRQPSISRAFCNTQLLRAERRRSRRPRLLRSMRPARCATLRLIPMGLGRIPMHWLTSIRCRQQTGRRKVMASTKALIRFPRPIP